MTATLDLLDKSDVMILWPILRPYFQAAIDHCDSGLEVDEIRQRALDGKRLIWTVTDGPRLLAALSSGTTRHPKGLTAYVDYLAGDDLDSWLGEKVAEFEARARAAGATRVEFGDGRLGWVKKLRAYGYRPARTVMGKAL